MTERRIVFVTGTRADFGKIKPLMRVVQQRDDLELSVFVTGMHMLEAYGSTWLEVQKSGFAEIHPYINQNLDDSMSAILGKTVLGFSDFVRERRPDLIVVHGDRVETLACASVGTLTSTLVAHIEGGEISGTVDEMLRHAVTKLAHIHLVANVGAQRNLMQLGESRETIHVIGSPDIDVMDSPHLPRLDQVLAHYDIPFREFGILLFHPVTTELDRLDQDVDQVVSATLDSGIPHIVIYPNNDPGSLRIRQEYRRFDGLDRIRMIPSMSFERFLTCLRSADYLLGNSSAGIREAPHFGTPTINVGTRQTGRLRPPSVIDTHANCAVILSAIREARGRERVTAKEYGDGKSAARFAALLQSEGFWRTPVQKRFVSNV